MKESQKSYYFSIIKTCCILILIAYLVSSSGKSLHEISLEWFLLAVTLTASLCFELVDDTYLYSGDGMFSNNRKAWFKPGTHRLKLICFITEIILTALLIMLFKEGITGLFLLPFVVYDTVIFMNLSFGYGLLSFLGVFINLDFFLVYLLYCMFVTIVYFQNFVIIEKYRKYIDDFEQKEYLLKDSIDTQSSIFKEQLAKSSLSYENNMLEEKARLSQALHDKLGHSINGSVYQLEACKLIMDKKPEESTKIIQAVIDTLRTSMDEIRMILREEKPDKKRMAYLQLEQLCSDCREKYGISADVKIEGEDKKIPETLWEIILDNTVEAVTNALKYSKCTQLSIKIIILHKVIRCSIHDNGIGCRTIGEGMGIQGMKKRARGVNGYIDISGTNGFHINMIFPLDEIKQE